MKKIPTVFKRDPNNLKGVLEEWHEDCLWVRDGEGVVTQKHDGTCTMLDPDGRWWARREVKPGKTPPENYRPVVTDPVTGKTMGWEPIEQSSFYKVFQEALEENLSYLALFGAAPDPGTYELVGPKINGNPEKVPVHRLYQHGAVLFAHVDRSYEELKARVLELHEFGIEGLVFHHPDGRMAKLKGRDFG